MSAILTGMKRLLPVLCVLSLVLLGGCQTKQEFKRFKLELKNSEVSIVGDDSFVLGRYTIKPLKKGQLWLEVIYFPGGHLRFQELEPMWYLPDSNLWKTPETILMDWKKNLETRSGSILTLSDVKTGKNEYGTYHYGVKGSDKGPCAISKQFISLRDSTT